MNGTRTKEEMKQAEALAYEIIDGRYDRVFINIAGHALTEIHWKETTTGTNPKELTIWAVELHRDN